MNEKEGILQQEDEISLLDLLAVLLRKKWLIIGITGIAILFIVVFSIISLKLPPEKSYLPNKYKVSANMLINDSDGQSMLSGASSTLTNLLGISMSSGGSSTSSLVSYLATSNPFLDAIAEEFDMYSTLPPNTKSPVATMRTQLLKTIQTNYDSSSGVFTISMEDIDPRFGMEVVDYSVNWLSSELDRLGIDKNKIKKENLENSIDSTWKQILLLTNKLNDLTNNIASGKAVWTKDITIEQTRIELELSAQKDVYKELKSQLEVLRVQMDSEMPPFQIIERPSVPDIKSGPSRGKLCIIVTFAAFFFAVFLAFLLNAIENIKNDPEAMKKLKGDEKVSK